MEKTKSLAQRLRKRWSCSLFFVLFAMGVSFSYFFLHEAGHALATAAPSSLEFDSVDAYIEKFMRDYRIPGLSLAVVKGDQVVHMRGFGVADPSARPVTAQTPFIIGSTSKSITALAMLQLVDAG